VATDYRTALNLTAQRIIRKNKYQRSQPAKTLKNEGKTTFRKAGIDMAIRA